VYDHFRSAIVNEPRGSDPVVGALLCTPLIRTARGPSRYDSRMRILIGTSGYSYKEWKGSFYPEDLPAAKMLSYYARHFPTVEINNTFYRMPARNVFEKWVAEVPKDFTFVIKAPQRITHQKRLAGADEDVAYLFDTASTLGDQLGAVLFQLPPFSRKDVPKLREFLAILPQDYRAAFEFRHDSWFDDEVYELLRSRKAALCMAETDETKDLHDRLVATAPWGYLRLRSTDYTDDEMKRWAERILQQPWADAFVFFKHEEKGAGPAFAKRLEQLLAGAP
jgi:uncharacterized protein YecE (DUF72 family)